MQHVLSVDVVANADADANVTLKLEDAWAAQADTVRLPIPAPLARAHRSALTRDRRSVRTCAWGRRADQVNSSVAAALSGNKLEAVLCVAGGWAGGNAADASTACSRRPPRPIARARARLTRTRGSRNAGSVPRRLPRQHGAPGQAERALVGDRCQRRSAPPVPERPRGLHRRGRRREGHAWHDRLWPRQGRRAPAHPLARRACLGPSGRRRRARDPAHYAGHAGQSQMGRC